MIGRPTDINQTNNNRESMKPTNHFKFQSLKYPTNTHHWFMTNNSTVRNNILPIQYIPKNLRILTNNILPIQYIPKKQKISEYSS
jgi:hypothetical protein